MTDDYKADVVLKIGTIEITTWSDGPILGTSKGIAIEGDLNVRGYLGSWNDTGTGAGAILMGHGYPTSSDPPQIVLTDSALGYYELLLIDVNRNYADLRVRDAVTESVKVNVSSTDPSNPVDGQIWYKEG